MIKFFRKIRRRLLTKNKSISLTGRYLLYAIGEVALVVMGIVIALQLNNWNDIHKNEDQFKAVLEQIYTVINQDADQLIRIQYGLAKQVSIIETVQRHPESINPKI